MHTAHGWIIHSCSDRLKQKLQFMMLRFYPLHIAVSDATRKLMVNKGIDPETISVLYNSIDTEYWKKTDRVSTVREEFGIPEESFIVGTVGRLSKEKDLPTFFKVARAVLAVKPNTYFFIIGDGKGRIVSDLQKQVKEMGIGQSVIFTGHRTDLRNFNLSFDLFLTTSLSEGLPNTLLEAMAMGVPVVATRVGGVPELVTDRDTGILCNAGDVDGITKVVLELLSNSGIRREFSINGQKRIAENFSFKKRLTAIEAIYKSLVKKT